jgi:hypothetical protein
MTLNVTNNDGENCKNSNFTVFISYGTVPNGRREEGRGEGWEGGKEGRREGGRREGGWRAEGEK